MLFTRRGFIAVGATALLSACSSTGVKVATKQEGGITPGRLTPAVIANAINATRKTFNAPALRYNGTLERAARNMANLMAQRNTISHTLGGTLRERVTAVNYDGAVGENLAAGYNTLEGAIQGWLDSPGHRSTLLSNRFVEFGLAAAVGSKKTYWAFIAGGDYEAWKV
jgi:uncharacterized protein YkwD